MRAGLQLFSVREAFASDPYGTLERIAEVGYRNIEFANHHADIDGGTGFGLPADKVGAKLKQLGLTAVGAHISPFREEFLDRAIGWHRDAGTKSIAISLDFWKSRAEVLERCKFYSRSGDKARAAGLKFLFHNHFHEYQPLDGETVMDTVVKNTDPEVVGLEIDAYWTFRGALDPAAMVRQYGNRVHIIHQKDFPFSQMRHADIWTEIDQNKELDTVIFHNAIHPEHFTEIGDGMIKVQDVINAGVEVGAGYILVEQDYGRMPSEFDRIARSLTNLRKLSGLDWGQ
jgi:sugar phosphate isomerase/epimerase